MSWGKKSIQSFCMGACLCFSISSSAVKAEEVLKKYIDTAVKVTERECNSLCVTPASKLYDLECPSDGIVTITNNNQQKEKGIVTVFCKDLKDILMQATLDCNEAASFYSVNMSRCIISWELIDGADTVCWAVKQKAVDGLSLRSAIHIEAGMQETNHWDNMDKWFVFTADKNGSIKISTLGLTNENTTLFVYKDCVNQSVGSSNHAANTLQSEAVIDVEAGQSYFIKWSSAFASGRYNWNIFYL